ncbi:hypothetical protein AAY473_010670 [Plecturocebus cupreus]
MSKINLVQNYKVESPGGVAPCTVPLNYAQKNLLKKLVFQSHESNFGSKIKDLDFISRETGNLLCT